MNYQQSRFQTLGKSIVQDNSDLAALQMLNSFNNPSQAQFQLQYPQPDTDRLALQVEKQNQLIQGLFKKIQEQQPQQGIQRQPYVSNSRIYQPNQLYQYMPALPPPPIFLPPNYSFMQERERQKQQQEKLRLLILMKELKEENFQLRMKLENKGPSQDASYEASSYQSSRGSQSKSQIYKQVAKPPKGPSKEDLDRESEQLKKMIGLSARATFVYRTRRLIKMLRFLNIVKGIIMEKCNIFRDQFPDKMTYMISSLNDLIEKITSPITERLKNTRNLILNCDAKTGQSDSKKRTDLLKGFVKDYVVQLVDNSGDISQQVQRYLLHFTHNFYCTPPFFLLKFEINRINFTTTGGTIMDPRKGQMMLLTIIWIRIYITYILNRWQPLQEGSKDAKANAQLQLNVHTVASVIYEIAMDFLRGNVAVQPNNQKMVPVEYQPNQKSQGVYKFPLFIERDKDKQKLENLKENDEPLLYPMHDRSDFPVVFQDHSFTETIRALLEGWAEQMYETVDQLKQDERKQVITKYQENQLPKLNEAISKVNGPPKQTIQYQQLRLEVSDQKQKVRDIKNFLNISSSRMSDSHHSHRTHQSRSKQ